MALVPINNQPVRLEKSLEREYSCGTSSYCSLYKKSTDDIILQLKQTPCDDSLVFDGDFLQVDYGSYWSFTYGSWLINTETGYAEKIPGTSDILYQDILASLPFVNANDYFEVRYTITGMTAGQMTVYLSATSVNVVTENGTYIEYVPVAALGNLLEFDANDLFDGRISKVSVYRLKKESEFTGQFKLYDANDTFRISPTSLECYDDRVNVKFETGGLSDGCYKVVVIDDCFDYFSADPGDEIISDPTFDFISDWAFTGSGGTVSGGVYVQTTIIGAGNNNITFYNVNPILPTGAKAIKIEIQTGTITDPNITLSIYAGVLYGSYTLIHTFINVQSSSTLSFQLPFDFDASWDSIKVNVNNPVAVAGHVNQLTSFSIKSGDLLELVSTYGYVSNCLSVKTDTGDALLIHGQPLEDVGSVDEYSNGFLFKGIFQRLSARLFGTFTSPHQPTNKGSYLGSDGVKIPTFAQKDKAWDFIFHPVDDNMHDTIAAMLNMRYFYIGESLTYRTRYISEDKDYSADWAKGEATEAESIVELSRVSGVVFM